MGQKPMCNNRELFWSLDLKEARGGKHPDPKESKFALWQGYSANQGSLPGGSWESIL